MPSTEVFTPTFMLITLTHELHAQKSVLLYLLMISNKTRMRVTPALLRAEVSRCRNDFRHFQSSEQHADGMKWLARYDFLLVSYSHLRFRCNDCRVISCQIQQTMIPKSSGSRTTPSSIKWAAVAYVMWLKSSTYLEYSYSVVCSIEKKMQPL